MPSCALIVVDVQEAFADPVWGRRDNLACEGNIAALIAHWRAVWAPGRLRVVNSAFHGTPSLQAWLDERGIRTIYVCGITTNHCCETTARVGGNLGYDVRFVLDATHTFDRPDPAGEIVPAEQLARVTATNLHGEFATVTSTAAVLSDR